MERRKLLKSGGFQFAVHSNNLLPVIYQFIENCRGERGQSLSMSFKQLRSVVSSVPDNFLLCTTKYALHIAAAAVVIKTSPYSWYQFYPAHSQKFNKYSPMVFLLSGLYNLARNEGVKMLDLGTSEFDGKPLEGLLKFKSRVGGERSFKEVYTKTL
jgi:lipid II:glycine glycyltransferase (peptidoglycan interpeptide bridge formation enzyme)